IVALARREQEIHHVQAESQVASASLLVEQSLTRHATDIAPRVDASFQPIGLDDQMIVRLTYRNFSRPRASDQHRGRRYTKRKPEESHCGFLSSRAPDAC